MRAFVTFQRSDGSTVMLGHGALIGRLWSAELCLDDARVSEAHAMVSLRGGELKLLSLRGRFAVGRKPLSEVVLCEGMVVQLARDLSLEVVAVTLPETVLAVEGERLPRQVLTNNCSLTLQPQPMLHPRHLAEADAWIWSDGAGWRLQVRGEPPRSLEAGDAWLLGGSRFSAISVSLERAGQARTHMKGRIAAPLHIVAMYDTVQIRRDGEAAVGISGIPARIISELVACGVPVGWEPVARDIWRADASLSSHDLRRRWDINLTRLRGKLKAAGVRPDLVRADGSGNYELFLYAGDRAEDQT